MAQNPIVTITMESGYDRLDMVTITPEVLAMSIQDAIECVGDCDCENVGDYIEENAEIVTTSGVKLLHV